MRACESAKDGTASSEHAKAASESSAMLGLRFDMVTSQHYPLVN